MVKRTHTCVDCGARVPPQDDDSALISVKYGWRLTRDVDGEGATRLEWRCPKCWIKYRETRPSPGTRHDDDT
jgi:hypothetical protein